MPILRLQKYDIHNDIFIDTVGEASFALLLDGDNENAE